MPTKLGVTAESERSVWHVPAERTHAGGVVLVELTLT